VRFAVRIRKMDIQHALENSSPFEKERDFITSITAGEG
jgi:hypothetical protein